MRIEYKELKSIAPRVRAELTRRGVIDPGRGKVRRKPRSREKTELLYGMARNRVEKCRPYRESSGRLVLPYYR